MEATSEKEYWYRVECRTEATGWSEFEERGFGHRWVMKVYALPVISHTPKGVWLDLFGTRKFVLNDSRKQYASPTKETALQGFIKRKHRQISILTARLTEAQEGLALAEKSGLENVTELRSGWRYEELTPRPLIHIG